MALYRIANHECSCPTYAESEYAEIYLMIQQGEMRQNLKAMCLKQKSGNQRPFEDLARDAVDPSASINKTLLQTLPAMLPSEVGMWGIKVKSRVEASM